MKIFKLFFLFIIAFFFFSFSSFSYAYLDEEFIFKAKVIEVGEIRDIPMEFIAGGMTTVQDIKVKIIEGDKYGREINLLNEFRELSVNNRVFVKYQADQGQYSLYEINRSFGIFFILFIFLAILLFFGGFNALKSLVALIFSGISIFFILIPGITAGYDPFLLSFCIAICILFFILFLTRGFNKGTIIAFTGILLAVLISIIFTKFFTEITFLTGLSSGEAFILNIYIENFDFLGLLVGAIIIGMLGALDDIAVTQVGIVREFYALNSKLSPKDAYKKAMKVGKEHVNSLVNTLILAYTSTSLPLILLYYQNPEPFLFINKEIFTTEIVRIVIGSIGLILAVPITTILAVLVLRKKK